MLGALLYFRSNIKALSQRSFSTDQLNCLPQTQETVLHPSLFVRYKLQLGQSIISFASVLAFSSQVFPVCHSLVLQRKLFNAKES